MVKTVLILGGSYAGLHVAHYLLKQKNKDVKVIIVSKNSHLYWNMASVRAIVPGVLPEDQLFQPLSTALSHYPSTAYELVIGSADASDFAAKTVTVGGRAIAYDQLVLATGASTASATGVPWKAAGSYEDVKALLRETTGKVGAAAHIVVAGAGATGVELAGELGYEFGGANAKQKKEIVLLAGGPEILSGDGIAGSARSELQKLGVKIRTNAEVVTSRQGKDGKTEVVLKDGEVLETDLYLPTMGLVPNSQYVDAKYLDEKKLVVVDEYYRVKGAENVWALGDVVSKPRAGFMFTQKQASGVAKNVEAALNGNSPSVVKLMPFDIFACAVGRGRGAGRMGVVPMFSIMVHMAKGKTLALERMAGYVDGSVA